MLKKPVSINKMDHYLGIKYSRGVVLVPKESKFQMSPSLIIHFSEMKNRNHYEEVQYF